MAKYGPETRKPLSYTARKSERRRSRDSLGKEKSRFALSIGLLGVANGSLRANGKLLASPRAAARQNGLAVLRLHPHPETVSLSALAIVRLKCAFWHVVALPRAKETLLPDLSRRNEAFLPNTSV